MNPFEKNNFWNSVVNKTFIGIKKLTVFIKHAKTLIGSAKTHICFQEIDMQSMITGFASGI